MTNVYRAVSSIIVRRVPLKETTKVIQNTTLKNITRKPNETVYLLVQKPRKHHAWQFPQGGQDKGETASDAALRELKEECGSDLKVKLIDDTPIGQYMYKFPENFNRWDDSIGAQVRESYVKIDHG